MFNIAWLLVISLLQPGPELFDARLTQTQNVTGWISLDLHYRGNKRIERMMIFLDGELQKTIPGPVQRFTWQFDTRTLANGSHQISVSIWESLPLVPLIAQKVLNFTSQNPETVRANRSRYGSMIVTPNQQFEIDNERISTTNQRNPSTKSTHTAPAVGEVMIGSTRVRVDPERSIRTFRYRDRPFFIRTMFGLTAAEFQRNPDLAEQVRRAGINTITTGFFANPLSSNPRQPYETWKTGYDSWFRNVIKPIERLDFAIVGTGDDFCRLPKYLETTLAEPWKSRAIPYAFRKLIDTERCVAIKMVDEANFLVGPPNDSIREFASIYQKLPKRPPVAWPISVMPSYSNTTAKNDSIALLKLWTDPSIGDVAWCYTEMLDFRACYQPGNVRSINQLRASYERAILNMPVDQPRVLMVPVLGATYYKKVPGNRYQLGDELYSAAWRPEVTLAGIWLAVAYGCSGVDLYHFDADHWQRDRTRSIDPIERTEGTAPKFSPDRWTAMSLGLNAVAESEREIFGTIVNARDWGPEFVTAARQSDRRDWFCAVNATESVRQSEDRSSHRQGMLLSVAQGQTNLNPVQNWPIDVPPGGVVILWSEREK